MSNIEIDKVLAQMKAMEPTISSNAHSKGQGVEFSSLLKASIDKVNDHQMQAGRLAKAFETGDPSVNLSDVMVSAQKSAISFEAMLQVRNKLVQAYQDVMNMPM